MAEAQIGVLDMTQKHAVYWQSRVGWGGSTFLATAQATLADTSRMEASGGYSAPRARSAARQQT